jgi:Zn-dependent protease/CBS domain-containing protein
MDQDIRLGTIDGIPVGINWSILVIFFLIVWELADLVLPAYHPHDSSPTYWAVALATSLLFFVSIFAHELSHSVVAKQNGIGVRRITFWLFGGVSELEGEALTPSADFRIAVIGPVTSFVLAGVFAVLAVLLHQSGGVGLLGSAFGWLAWMNLLLGVFNLIPAAPLDGGRVLRSVLWRRSGDRVRAATSAARAGQVFAYILVTLGVLEFLEVGIIGLWFVFLGWYLLTAARAEESSVVLRSSLANVHVRDIMTPDPVTFSATTTVAELIDTQLHHHRFNTYPLVGADGKLEGLATMGRIRHVPANARETTRLIDIACPLSEVPIGAPSEPIPELLQRMQAAPDGRALVIDENGAFVGVVSPSDIARYVQLCMLQSQGRAARKG